MTAALGQLLASGVGVALSPIPIIAVILMLTGWLIGLAVATGVVLLVASGADQKGSSAADGAHIATLVVGLLFLALAFKQWTGRPKGGEAPELPAWMAGIDGFSAVKALGLGGLLSGLNPKNLAMAVSAGVALAQTGAAGGQTVLGAAIFIVIGSLTVAVPVVGSLVSPSRTAPVLADAKAWLGANNRTIMIILFLVLGASKTGEGLASILA